MKKKSFILGKKHNILSKRNNFKNENFINEIRIPSKLSTF